MNYSYLCDNCGTSHSRGATEAQLNDDDWNPPQYIHCEMCDSEAMRVFKAPKVLMDKSHATEVKHIGKSANGHSQFEFIGSGFPDVDSRLQAQVDEVESIMEEDVCAEEIDVGNSMLEERERELDYHEGRLTGDREVEEIEMEVVSDEEIRKQKAQGQIKMNIEVDNAAHEANIDIGAQDLIKPVKVSQHELSSEGFNSEVGKTHVISKKQKKRGKQVLQKEAQAQAAIRQGLS